MSPYRLAQFGWVERAIARERRERIRQRAAAGALVLLAVLVTAAWATYFAQHEIRVDTRGVHVEVCP